MQIIESKDILNNLNFSKWFENSKTKNEYGVPMIFYHKSRSNEKFEEFRDDINKNPYNDCKGFYFVNHFNSNSFKHFANGVDVFCYLKMTNPLYLYYKNPDYHGSNEEIYNMLNINNDFVERVKSQGFDSIVISNLGVFNAVDEYIVFDQNQIKHIDNTEFSDSPNIYK